MSLWIDDTTGERYIEFWNLVFMQFNRDLNGKLTPLPKQSIDTGSGLERVVALKMGVENVFETDILGELIRETERITGKKYEQDSELGPAFHVIADHLRSLAFAIADGAQPSNVDRGYVLRKLLRRAVRYARMLGVQDPFLAKILPRLVDLMGDDYHELRTAEHRIAEILTLEEEAFLRTLKRGGNILNKIIFEAQKNKEISGEDAFKLKDTYGLPFEEILLIAKDSHLTINLEAYEILEEQAREKSKAAHVKEAQHIEENLLSSAPRSEFLGYQQTRSEAKILAILVGNQFVELIREGEQGVILLDQTPFYAEKGGQIGDTGHIDQFVVTDCKSPYPGVIAHIGICPSGILHVGETVVAEVDVARRINIQNNHTATHLLHWALMKVLGPHVRQAGSVVEPSRFRFDFNHHKALSKEEIEYIENLVNEKIRENKPVHSYELSYEEAQKMPEIKQFFGDKYGAKVRVIDIEESKELCGGTHTSHTGTIGYFRILKEGSIAAGVRRIEAITGHAAEEFVRHHEKELEAKIAAQIEETKKIEHQLKTTRRAILREMAQTLTHKIEHVGSTPLLATVVSVQPSELSQLVEEVMTRITSGVVLLAAEQEGKCQIILRVTPDLLQKGIHADKILKEVAPLVGGSGGGRPEGAQAGGKSPENLPKLISQVRTLLKT